MKNIFITKIHGIVGSPQLRLLWKVKAEVKTWVELANTNRISLF